MMPTLVVHTGGIGDFLVACPAIAALEGPVELLGCAERLAVAVEAGVAAAAHDLDAVAFHTLLWVPGTRLRRLLERFDRAFVFMRDSDGTLERALRRCGLEDVRLHPGLPDADWKDHATAYYARCLGAMPDPAFRLNIAGGEDAHDVMLHPGSGSPAKNWPIERFQRLAGMLEDDGRRVAWCLGPAERERGAGEELQGPVVSCDSLVELARVLAGTRLYIGNDSGITHLAAMLGCPTVAVFGPTDPAVWGPRGPHVRVVCEPAWPEAERVYEAVLEAAGVR